MGHGDFTGKRVLVTGAAKGIGLATAKLLTERGAEVIAFDRTVVDLADVEATRAAVREADCDAGARRGSGLGADRHGDGRLRAIHAGGRHRGPIVDRRGAWSVSAAGPSSPPPLRPPSP